MTTIGLTQDARRTTTHPVRSGSRVRQALLACGVLSSLLYLATDIIGGLRDPAYSFWSQTISELGAIGAPSQPVVAPLFMVYPVLAFAFAVGIIWQSGRRNRALRVTGALLAVYTVVGVVGFTSSPIHQRGTGSLASDLPHIIVAGMIVFFWLATMGVGAFALGKRFRIYSFATLVTVLVFFVLTALYVPRVAANEPTPGLGIIERIDVYAAMLWLAVLATALLRDHRYHDVATKAPAHRSVVVGGRHDDDN